MSGLPVPADCDSYAKEVAWVQSVALIRDLCETNGFTLPRIRRNDAIAHYGYYWPQSRLISVSLKRCVRPTRAPGHRWSFPGYKADLTVAGVLLHELGHHFQAEAQRFLGRSIVPWILEVKRAEERVTSCESNAWEVFAEAFRLFALNPDFLRRAAASRMSAAKQI